MIFEHMNELIKCNYLVRALCGLFWIQKQVKVDKLTQF